MTAHFHVARFLSLKWKSALTLLALLVALIAVLAWHFYQNFEKNFLERLAEERLRQIASLDETIHRSGETLHRVFGSFIVNNNGDPAEAQTIIKRYGPSIDVSFNGLVQNWAVDEIVVLDSFGNPAYARLGNPAATSWLLPWTQGREPFNNLSPVGIYCATQCKQVLAFPLFVRNQRIGIILVSRSFDQLARQLTQLTGAYLGIAQLITPENAASFAKTDIVSPWNVALNGYWNDATLHDLVQKAAQQYSLETVMGASFTVEHLNRNYSVTALPIRGSNADNTRYLLLADVSRQRESLTATLLQQITVVSFLIAVFIIYLIAVSWRHLRRIRQQIAVLPLLGEKQFREAREIVGNNRQHVIYRDELDTLDDVVTTLSYQLETLEKAVSVRTREMERLSLFDTLTGLANRNLFLYELQSDVDRFNQDGGMLAAVILDLDKFKRINDSISHQQGDILLGKVGQRLKHATKSLGLVARLGGDEFAIILRSAKMFHQVELICQKILDLIHKPIDLDGQPIVVSCSLGIALAGENFTANDLIRNAEIAMYNAKDAGGNAYRIFSKSMATQAHASLTLETEIRRAFEQKEFTLYLQPKVNMDSEIEGFESLIRWDHPDRGLVPPNEFIPAMENMGVISSLDNFVLDASCWQLKVLQTHYPDVSIAVNISSVHFTDKNFLQFLKECLIKYPIDPSRLELEITETLLMENMNVGMEIISQIKELGVSIAIDDFGTGYSSLSYLKKLPVDTIKIDREFIKDIPDSESDMQISSVIIFLAKQLNFKVVAEGVETAAQLAFLKANQCDLAQGFLFSKPIPAHKAMLLLESQRRDKKLGKVARQ